MNAVDPGLIDWHIAHWSLQAKDEKDGKSQDPEHFFKQMGLIGG